MRDVLQPAAVLLAVAVVVPVTGARADCLTDSQVAELAGALEAGVPVANPAVTSKADGTCTRQKLNAVLEARLGPPIGYKAGLTNPAVQQRFRHDEPVRGTLYRPMLLQSGATVDAGFGARPQFEADLLVRVSNPAINSASTPAQVLAAVDQIIPFIELPDLLVADPGALDGAAIMAINVGARLGVTGEPVPVEPGVPLVEMLREMQVVMRGDGVEMDRGTGSDVLGHPLAAVIWLAQDLARENLALQPGDLVSLGSFSRLHIPRPGLDVEVEYRGLPGNPRLAVHFR